MCSRIIDLALSASFWVNSRSSRSLLSRCGFGLFRPRLSNDQQYLPHQRVLVLWEFRLNLGAERVPDDLHNRAVVWAVPYRLPNRTIGN